MIWVGCFDFKRWSKRATIDEDEPKRSSKRSATTLSRLFKVFLCSHTIHRIFAENRKIRNGKYSRERKKNLVPIWWIFTEIFQLYIFFSKAFMKNNKMHCIFKWQKYSLRKLFLMCAPFVVVFFSFSIHSYNTVRDPFSLGFSLSVAAFYPLVIPYLVWYCHLRITTNEWIPMRD